MEHLLDQLSPEAKSEIEKLLHKQEHSTEKTILIDGDTRRKLETLFGKNLTTADDILKNVEHALEFEIDGVTFALTPNLMDRLKTRSIGMSFDRFLPWIIKRQLEEYCGLR